MISKQKFVETINILKEQTEQDGKFGAFIDEMFETDCSRYKNYKLIEATIDLLKEQLNDNSDYSWIDYYCYEMDFGNNPSNLKAYYKNDGPEIDLSSPEALYDFLIEDQKDDGAIESKTEELFQDMFNFVPGKINSVEEINLVAKYLAIQSAKQTIKAIENNDSVECWKEIEENLRKY